VTDIASGPPAPGSQAGRRPEAIKAIPVRHPWRWVSAVVVLAIAVDVAYTMATAPNLSWQAVWTWLFRPFILGWIVITIELTVLAMVIGIVLGVVLAVMRLSPNPVMSWVSWLYIWFFRGTPVLVQIFFWYNLNAVLPHIGFGIPGTPLGWYVGTNSLINAFIAATLGLGLNEAAYMAEIVRAGIISVEHGQTEAAQALGMTRLQVMRRIVLPQAMRVIIPPTGNELISMLKTTSHVTAVPYTIDLYETQRGIAGVIFRPIPLLLVASTWYLAITSVLMVGQYFLERHYAKGSSRTMTARQLRALANARVELRDEGAGM